MANTTTNATTFSNTALAVFEQIARVARISKFTLIPMLSRMAETHDGPSIVRWNRFLSCVPEGTLERMTRCIPGEFALQLEREKLFQLEAFFKEIKNLLDENSCSRQPLPDRQIWEELIQAALED